MTSLAVKRVGPDTIEGLAIPFATALKSGKDLVGESFDANTDLCIDWFGSGGRPLLYDHGLDKAHKAVKVGRQTEYETREEGIWAQSQLDLNARYRKAVDELIEREAVGYSSGAMPHLSTKNARTGLITRWPWVELSLTPIPAEPLTLGVHYMKSIGESLDLLEADGMIIPSPVKAALAAVDTWAETRDEAHAATSYAEEYDRLLVASKAFVDRSSGLSDLRAKSGRVLSASNRSKLSELRERIASATESASGVLADLDSLLVETDPEAAAEASKALWGAVFEALAEEARSLGVDVIN